MTDVIRGLLLVVLCAAPAAAQQIDRHGVPYRQWDIQGSGGFHMGRPDESGPGHEPFQDNWEPAWLISFDLGRYWNSHVKTEAGLAWLSQVEYYGGAAITGPTGQVIGQDFSRIESRQTQIVLAGTYQFLENTFAHPYVSAGARIGILDLQTTTTRYFYGSPGAPAPGPVEPLVENRQQVRVRPHVAVGSKSYFSERVFIRPEMLVAFDGAGVSQYALRLGLGIDF